MPPKYEKAALRWLERYLTEGSPRLRHFAEVATDLAERESSGGLNYLLGSAGDTRACAGRLAESDWAPSPSRVRVQLVRGGAVARTMLRAQERWASSLAADDLSD